ncbi:MAG: hypothetical protein ACRDVG_02225 [Jatrophihabitantaceae bacterium]
MQPDEPARPPEPVPDILRKGEVPPRNEPEVGEFRQGSATSQWALARYLVGRAITEAAGWSLMFLGVLLVVLAVLAQILVHSTFLAVVLGLLAVGVLVLRWLLLGIVRRLTGFQRFGPLEDRMRALVDDTRADVLRELRRIGLPGRIFTLPLLAFRFLGRERRADTVARLRLFETERAVPRARLDELHLVMREAFGGGSTSGPEPPTGWQTGRHG